MSYTIVLVDDNPAVHKIIRQAATLSGFPWTVEYFTEAGEALERIHASPSAPVHLYLIDLVLGTAIDGFRLMNAVLETSTDVPILVISGTPDARAARQDMIDSGALAFLEKPFDSSLARAQIDQLLRRTYQRPNRPLAFGSDWRYEPATQSIFHGDRHVAKLKERRAQLFELLLQNMETGVTIKELTELLYPEKNQLSPTRAKSSLYSLKDDLQKQLHRADVPLEFSSKSLGAYHLRVRGGSD